MTLQSVWGVESRSAASIVQQRPQGRAVFAKDSMHALRFTYVFLGAAVSFVSLRRSADQ